MTPKAPRFTIIPNVISSPLTKPASEANGLPRTLSKQFLSEHSKLKTS